MYVPLSEVNESSCWSRRSSIDMNDICITIVLTILSCKIHRLNEMKIKESFSFLCFCLWSMCLHVMWGPHGRDRMVFIPPSPPQRSCRGVYWFHHVCPSVCRQILCHTITSFFFDDFHFCRSRVIGLSFLVGTISNVLVMEIGWTDVGSGGYILVSCAHSNTSWIYTYLFNQYPSSLMLWVWTLLRWGVLHTTICDKVCQWFTAGQRFSPGNALSIGRPIWAVGTLCRSSHVSISETTVLNGKKFYFGFEKFQ
jgi:hypothetical protein